MWWQLVHVPFHSLSPPSHLPLSHPGHTQPQAHVSFCRSVRSQGRGPLTPQLPLAHLLQQPALDHVPGLVSEAGRVRNSTMVACPLFLPQTLRDSLASVSHPLGLSLIQLSLSPLRQGKGFSLGMEEETDKLSLQRKASKPVVCTTQSQHWADSSPLLACVPAGVCMVWVWCVLV